MNKRHPSTPEGQTSRTAQAGPKAGACVQGRRSMDRAQAKSHRATSTMFDMSGPTPQRGHPRPRRASPLPVNDLLRRARAQKNQPLERSAPPNVSRSRGNIDALDRDRMGPVEEQHPVGEIPGGDIYDHLDVPGSVFEDYKTAASKGQLIN